MTIASDFAKYRAYCTGGSQLGYLRLHGSPLGNENYVLRLFAYDMTTSVSTRLHITPLDAGLIPIVLGSHLAQVAENILFQTVATFPENNYGFVDLPETEAKILIAKLNGAILKGRKMKVEKARSKKRSHDAEQQDTAADQEKSQRKSKRSKKDRNAEDGVLEGYQLPSDRKVKRGWTEPKSEDRTRHRTKSKDKDKTKKSKRQTPSQFTEKEELLFRTELPPNKQYLDQDSKSRSKSKSKSNNKDKQTPNTETVVHEFQRTEIQPAFVRDTASSGQAAEYIDDVGWVDENGNVVESTASSISRRTKRSAEPRRIAVPKSDGAKISDMQDQHAETASSGSSSSAATGTDDEDVDTMQKIDATSDSASTPSTSTVDSDSESNQDHEEDGQEARSDPHSDEQVGLETPQKVHPLEALFKRPHPPAGQEAAKPSLEIETSFSFFDQSTADADDDLPAMPATPFTSNDMRSRGVRSAAPTPDTAHPSRFTGFAGLMATRLSREQSMEDSQLNTVDNDKSVPGSEKPDRVQSDFEKRFWAERGQNNRAWKNRRKTALKEQRQKENRLRRPKNW